jgi:hypothetical protein
MSARSNNGPLAVFNRWFALGARTRGGLHAEYRHGAGHPMNRAGAVAPNNRIRPAIPRLLAAAYLALAAMAFGAGSDKPHSPDRSHYAAPRALAPVVVDGSAADSAWSRVPWRAIDHLWLGETPDARDFRGRFKVTWDASRIYLLVEVVDDVLYDAHRNPLVQYWDDDCLEIFIDEDFSGGEHQYNHNAFAYHLSLDNRAIDIGTDREARDYSHHVESQWRQYDGHLLWEVAITIYDDSYVDGAENTPVRLAPGKIMGLMVAYCDNDGSEIRENFVGSESVPTGKKDRGWIDAGLFGALELTGQ